MSTRLVRVNNLIQKELSSIIHSRFQSEAAHITITQVKISPDLRKALIFYSVFGDASRKKDAFKFLSKNLPTFRSLLSKSVILKYTPELKFLYDESTDRAFSILNKMQDLQDESHLPNPPST